MKVNHSGGKMAAPPQYLHRQVNIHPREADDIADEIHKLVTRFMSEYTKFNKEFILGTANWTGHQQMLFYDKAYPRIGKLAEFIEYIKTQETFYRSLMVWIWEDYINPDWEAYMNNMH
jgi:hypothetical protein